ncbi:hypothetical protein BH20ACT11_BH20ACT11_02460 [soil metagenome]
MCTAFEERSIRGSASRRVANVSISHGVAVQSDGEVDEQTQVRVARISSFAVGVLAIVLGLLVQGLNVAVLVILAIAVAASSNFPIIALSLFWRRFNTWG